MKDSGSCACSGPVSWKTAGAAHAPVLLRERQRELRMLRSCYVKDSRSCACSGPVTWKTVGAAHALFLLRERQWELRMLRSCYVKDSGSCACSVPVTWKTVGAAHALVFSNVSLWRQQWISQHVAQPLYRLRCPKTFHLINVHAMGDSLLIEMVYRYARIFVESAHKLNHKPRMNTFCCIRYDICYQRAKLSSYTR